MTLRIRSPSDVASAPAVRRNCLYRYRAINDWLEPILKGDEMYFSDKNGLNDPFDLDVALSVHMDKAKVREKFDSGRTLAEHLNQENSVPDVHKIFLPFIPFSLWRLPDEYARSAEKYFAWRRDFPWSDSVIAVRDYLIRFAGKIGICCFSHAGDDVLMFSYYGDSHRGCCLEFDSEDDEGKYTSIFPQLSFADCRDVAYQTTPARVLVFEAGFDEVISAMFYTKHERWSYEREVRFVRQAGAGVERFRRDALTGITFGCKTTEADQKRVIEWLGAGRSVQLRKAIKVKSGLEIVPL